MEEGCRGLWEAAGAPSDALGAGRGGGDPGPAPSGQVGVPLSVPPKGR